MKNVMTKLTIAAAAFMAVATVASAQTMEAKIPFSFRASGKVLAAGTYRVNLQSTASGSKVLTITSKDGAHDVFTAAYPGSEAQSSWRTAGNPMLSFECGVSRCVLSEIWTAGSAPVYHLPTPKLGNDEPIRTAEIVMHPATAN